MESTLANILLEGIRDLKEDATAERAAASESRRRVFEKLESITLKVELLTARVAETETRIKDMSPSIAEFNSMKQKVSGAGKLGRFLWGAGGVVLSVALWLVTAFSSIPSWLKPPSGN